MDEHYQEWLEQAAKDNLNFFKAEQKLACLDEAIVTADKYGIFAPAVLDSKLRELHALHVPSRRAIFNLENYLENTTEIKKWIDQYQRLEPILHSVGINPNDIVFIPDTQTIQKNKAQLNPTWLKTRSDLFKAVYHSPYTLTRKFYTLTETEAQEILKAIHKNQKDNLPDGLFYGRIDKEQNREDSTIQPKYRVSSNKPKLPLKQYDKKIQQAILDFKSTADRLASYGLTNAEEITFFLKDIADKTKELDLQKAVSDKIHMEIKDLFRLKRNLERFQKAVFIYGPLYSGNIKSFQDSMDRLKKEYTNTDILIFMKKRLEQLPDIHREELQHMDIPSPEEYRFFHDLTQLYPSFAHTDKTSPENLHHLIVRLKHSKFFDKEIEKEQIKEKKYHLTNVHFQTHHHL